MAAVVAYGKLELALHDREKATDFLMCDALKGSRVAIQKELATFIFLIVPTEVHQADPGSGAGAKGSPAAALCPSIQVSSTFNWSSAKTRFAR